MPISQSAVEKLLREFLSRESDATARAYKDALDDYRHSVRANSTSAALVQLLGTSSQKAEARLARYKQSLVGKRDKSGNLVEGRGLSPASVNLRLTVLRSIIKHAKRRHLIEWDVYLPGVKSEGVKDVRGPGEETLNRMLAIAKSRTGPQGKRDYAVLRLAGELGLRRREILGLDIDDVDLDTGELAVLGKGRRAKETITCGPKTVEAIKAWLTVRPQPRAGAPLFTNLIRGRANRISGPAVYLIIRSLGKEALPRSRRKISPHRIRHTAITSAIKQTRECGLAREEVKKFSRHADMRMLGKYFDAEDKAQAMLAHSVGERLV